MTARWELELPLWEGKPPLTSNETRRMHWRVERARIKFIRREATEWRAREAKIPPCDRISVGLHYLPGDKRRRDASNLIATQKPAVDALVRLGIVPDDCAPYVTEQMPVIHLGPGARRLWLVVESTSDNLPEVHR
jgi:crossover junction endodeoxyribonuclease RusA